MVPQKHRTLHFIPHTRPQPRDPCTHDPPHGCIALARRSHQPLWPRRVGVDGAATISTNIRYCWITLASSGTPPPSSSTSKNGPSPASPALSARPLCRRPAASRLPLAPAHGRVPAGLKPCSASCRSPVSAGLPRTRSPQSSAYSSSGAAGGGATGDGAGGRPSPAMAAAALTAL